MSFVENVVLDSLSNFQPTINEDIWELVRRDTIRGF